MSVNSLTVEHEDPKRKFGNTLPLPKGTTLQKAYVIAMADYRSTKRALEKSGITLGDPETYLTIGWKAKEE